MKKILLFLQKHSLKIFAILFVIISSLFLIIFALTGKKNLDFINKKIDIVVDKAQDKVKEIEIKQVEIEVEKKIKLEEIEKKKEDYSSKIEIIKTISDKEKRLKKMIELNKSIDLKK